MSLDIQSSPPRNIAVVGGGISGMATAYLLSQTHNVTLIEAAPRLGGHARTVIAGKNGDQSVDTGFIVFNYETYPHLTKMFADLDVPVEKSDMSFAASINDGEIEYGLRDLSALTCQPRNLLRPGFLRLVRDILRFNARAVETAQDPNQTIGEFMETLNLGDWFRDYYLLPVSGAIWSTPPDKIKDFPAKSLVQFFENHALLTPNTHQWWTVSGGSIQYVNRLQSYLERAGVRMLCGAPVKSVSRGAMGVNLALEGTEAMQFDEVVLACHAPQSLGMLSDITPEETAALSKMRYQPNHAILHRDSTIMPKRRKCWSSWVYHADHRPDDTAIGVTYWMNNLQNIPETDPLYVTLNAHRDIAAEHIYDEVTFEHPIFDLAALKGQQELRALQGQNRTWFAGAYMRHGFHEDGFASAVDVARLMGAMVE